MAHVALSSSRENGTSRSNERKRASLSTPLSCQCVDSMHGRRVPPRHPAYAEVRLELGSSSTNAAKFRLRRQTSANAEALRRAPLRGSTSFSRADWSTCSINISQFISNLLRPSTVNTYFSHTIHADTVGPRNGDGENTISCQMRNCLDLIALRAYQICIGRTVGSSNQDRSGLLLPVFLDCGVVPMVRGSTDISMVAAVDHPRLPSSAVAGSP